MRRNITQVLALVLAAIMLAGCGRTEEETKPVLDPQAIETLPESPAEEGKTQRLAQSETFQNGDGSVTFALSLNQELIQEPLPALEVTTHYMTADDAWRVAQGLFGPEAKFYEREPEYSTNLNVYNKAQVKEWIQQWRSYDAAYLQRLYGSFEDAPYAMSENGEESTALEFAREYADYFEQRLDQIPEEDMREPCRWKTRKEMEYHQVPEEAARMDLSQDDDSIQAIVEVGDKCYFYGMYVQNSQYNKRSQISTGIHTTSPNDMDFRAVQAKYLRTEEPTPEQLENIRKLAEEYIEKIGMGQWRISNVRVDMNDRYGTPEYWIDVNALPAGALFVEGREVVASFGHEGVAEMYFAFNADGVLMDFTLRNPIGEVKTAAERPAVLTAGEMIEAAKEDLKNRSAAGFGLSEHMRSFVQESYEEDIQCQVEITGADYQYIQMETTEDTSICVPALVLSGKVAYVGSATGRSYTEADMPFFRTGERPLVAVNALDGMVLEMNG